MNLKCLDYKIFKNEVENLYLKAFPRDERFPFWILEECCKEKNSDLYAIEDKGKFVGMCYIVNCDSAYYLMYLAVDFSLRNQKYGSKILQDLKEKYKTLFLSIDNPIDEISKRRKNFYLRNGFFDTNKVYEDTGVFYEILCTNSEFEITGLTMQKRYLNMSQSPQLSKEISNIFNANLVELKDNSTKELN